MSDVLVWLLVCVVDVVVDEVGVTSFIPWPALASTILLLVVDAKGVLLGFVCVYGLRWNVASSWIRLSSPTIKEHLVLLNGIHCIMLTKVLLAKHIISAFLLIKRAGQPHCICLIANQCSINFIHILLLQVLIHIWFGPLLCSCFVIVQGLMLLIDVGCASHYSAFIPLTKIVLLDAYVILWGVLELLRLLRDY